MRTAIWVKDNKLPLAIKYYDAIYYKLLQINVANSNQLMMLIHKNRLSSKLKRVHGDVPNNNPFRKLRNSSRKPKTNLLALKKLPNIA